jgi:hypothetical protein
MPKRIYSPMDNSAYVDDSFKYDGFNFGSVQSDPKNSFDELTNDQPNIEPELKYNFLDHFGLRRNGSDRKK